jgi:LacI family transcriptional regulator
MPTATIRDVARQAEVSVASASRALNGHANVTPATRDRVLAAARALDYSPHPGARSLSTRRTGMIGVVLPDLFGEFFSELIRGIDHAVHAHGLHLLLTNMRGSADDAAAALRAMRGRVDGLLVMSPQSSPAFLRAHLPHDLPAVILNGDVTDTHGAIGVDNRAGAHAAVAHLVAQGCRRIAHIAGPAGNLDADQRAEAFRAAVADLLGDRDPLILQGNFTEAAGATGGAMLAGSGTDGLFCANDMTAIGAMHALIAAGVRVPEDVAIVGFDDVPVARYVTPTLSSLGVDIAGLGAQAVARLLRAVDGQAPDAVAHQLLTPALSARGSSNRQSAGTINDSNPVDREQGRLT